MEWACNTKEAIKNLQAEMAAQLSWLKSCQILCPEKSADGAIARYPDKGLVTPYFSNFAAMAMMEDPSSYPLVERYIEWYLRNLEKNGTIFDYHYDENRNYKTKRPDSEDAYAGTYLSLVACYHKKTGQTGWVKKNLPALKKVARSIVNLMDRDGLTFALASYKVKYLMDNCEAYRGLADFAGLLKYLEDEEAGYFKTREESIAQGIEKVLWNPRGFHYYPCKTGWFRPGVNLKKFYPDAACQVFPVLHGLIDPGSERGTHLYKMFNINQPGWVYIKPPDYPWMLLGYYACLHGDYKKACEKVLYAREAYIKPGSGNWFCAEAAFFILTCARLIRSC